MTAVHLAQNWPDEITADIENAAYSIAVTSLSMQPPRSAATSPIARLFSELYTAARRGVAVTAYLATPSESHPATLYNHSAGQYLHDRGIRTIFARPDKLLHAKTTIIDGKICWIGSGNLTAAAAHHNHEAYVRIESPEIAGKLLARWAAVNTR